MNANTVSWLIAAVFLYSVATAAEPALDEIVVTADFRERPASEIPSSVTVMNASQIRQLAVQHFEELVNQVPNLNWSGDGHRARYFQIRGVGELEQYQGAPNPSIGFIIDDIDFSGIGTVATLFDMQSIEVLRGSQGSRYGANALGGLIYMRSTAPSAQRNGRVQISAGGDDAFSFGAAFGGALNAHETVTMRLSAHKHESNGFRDNTYLNRKDTNGRDEAAFRARLQFEPNDSFQANVALMATKIDNGYDAFSLDNSYTMLSDKPGKDAQESIGASLRLDWSDFGAGSLTSITSIANSDMDFSFDADWGNDDSWGAVTYDYISLSERERRTLSQEFRYTTDNWLLGIYALDLTEDLQTLNQGDYYDPFYDWADSLDYPFDSAFDATNVAVFGQFNNEIGPSTRLSAGLRLERRSTNYRDSDGLMAAPQETLWGGEVSISHDIGDTLTTFATLSKGYKASGFNLGLVPGDTRFFTDESLWAIEIGLKSAFLGDALLVNASVFHNWRTDQQVRTSFQLMPGDPTSFGFATLNVDEATTAGIEAELRWMPHEDWELYSNIGLLDSTFRKLPAGLGIDSLLGRAQAHAPAYTLAAGVIYSNESGVFARVDATAKDEFYFDVSHDQKSRSYGLVNARVGYAGERWLVSLWARNLLDEAYAVRGFYFGNEPPDFPATQYTRLGDARQVGITLERRF